MEGIQLPTNSYFCAVRSLSHLIVIVGLISLWGCKPEPLMEQIQAVDGYQWNVNDRKSFDFTITDTLISYDLFFHLRTTAGYPYNNMFVLMLATGPGGKTKKDRYEFLLADPSGRWYGKGLGDLYDFMLLNPNLSRIRFHEIGTYHFDLIQNMRSENLDGVVSVGLSVLPHNQ